MLVTLLMASSLMYIAEHEAQPNRVSSLLPTAILTAGMLEQIHVERKNDNLEKDKN